MKNDPQDFITGLFETLEEGDRVIAETVAAMLEENSQYTDED